MAAWRQWAEPTTVNHVAGTCCSLLVRAGRAAINDVTDDVHQSDDAARSLRNAAGVVMHPSCAQYDALSAANHHYVMTNSYWPSPASAAAVSQLPYYSQ